MGIKERIFEVMGIVSRTAADGAARRAYEAGYSDGEDEPATSTLQTYGYRSLQGQGTREGQLDWNTRLNVAYELLEASAYKRIAEIKRDYIIGSGVTIQAQDPPLQEILDTFWAVNQMDVHASEFAHQLYALGAQLFTLGVRESDGLVRLGYIDPGEIERVITDPANGMARMAVVIREQAQTADDWYQAQPQRVFRLARVAQDGENADRYVMASQAILADWERAMLNRYGKAEYDGTCLYYRVNALSNETLGHSDALTAADTIEQMNQTLFALGEREQMAGYFSFDVTLAKASKEDVAARAAALRSHPPKRGSVNVHNDGEVWTLHAPELGQAGSVETVKEQLSFICGLLGIPVSWFGRGDETNRATAQAQADPTWRSMGHDQLVVRSMLVEMLELARDQAIIAGKYVPVEGTDTSVDVIMPEMTVKDIGSISAALSSLVGALMTAEQQGWIAADHAKEIVAKVLGEIGVKIDVSELPAEAEEQPDMTADWERVSAPVEA